MSGAGPHGPGDLDPVLGALLEGGELESVDLRIAVDPWGGETVVVRLTACDEHVEYWLCPAEASVSAGGVAEHLYHRLQDDIVECRFAWGGEPRSGGYVVPPPAG